MADAIYLNLCVRKWESAIAYNCMYVFVCNIASGCPTFCPLSELSNHAYIRDDTVTMFIKIIVDTTDL